MYKGIYIALSGGTAKQTQMEVITHNLANANTLGYKKDKMTFQSYLLSQINGSVGNPADRVMTDVSSVETDFSAGNMVKSGNVFDLALDGKGFFSIEGGLYTRRGDFRVEKGYLVTQDGKKVLGKGGPVKVPAGKIEVDNSGRISVDGAEVGSLKIADFDDLTALKKSGSDYFASDKKEIASKAGVKQGFIETSNVEAIREMVKMITTVREFETYQKAMQSFDEAVAKVTNDMARI